MKQKDIALIIMVCIISALASVFISKALFSKTQAIQKVEVVQAIQTDFQTPDSKYFNSNSIDPTQLITIGDSTNQQPFNGKPQ